MKIDTKKLTPLIFLAFSISACDEADLKSQENSLTAATVHDMREFGGSCTFTFELEDGSLIDPIFPLDFCKTLPSSKIELEEGMKVLISFEKTNLNNICSFGPVVKIKEIKKINP